MRSGYGRPLSKTGKMIHFFNGKVFADNDKFNRKIFADVNQAPLPAIGAERRIFHFQVAEMFNLAHFEIPEVLDNPHVAVKRHPKVQSSAISSAAAGNAASSNAGNRIFFIISSPFTSAFAKTYFNMRKTKCHIFFPAGVFLELSACFHPAGRFPYFVKLI